MSSEKRDGTRVVRAGRIQRAPPGVGRRSEAGWIDPLLRDDRRWGDARAAAERDAPGRDGGAGTECVLRHGSNIGTLRRRVQSRIPMQRIGGADDARGGDGRRAVRAIACRLEGTPGSR
jgi:hypothetical protein